MKTINHTQIAKSLNITLGAWSNKYHGRRHINVFEAVKLAGIFGLDALALMQMSKTRFELEINRVLAEKAFDETLAKIKEQGK